MPDPLVVQLANEFRRQLQARDAVQMAEMARRWLQVERRLRGEINGLAQEMYARWWEGGAHGDRRTLLELDRYRALLAQVQREMQAYQRYAEDAITTGQATRAQMGIHDAGRLIEAASGGEIYAGFRRLPVEAVHNIVALARGGQPLARLLELAYPQAAEGITALLLEGTALGWNPRRTAARIMDDGLAQGLNHILLVARDQQIRAYRTAALQQYRESGLVVSYRRLAAKQPRTCLACLALDGREYPTEELMPLHPQDRCAMVPVVKGFEPIQFETGEAWFGRQSPAVQAKMMGPGRYDAWTKGEFAFRELATVKPNEVWGPRAQVTPLKDLLSTRVGHSWFKGELPSVAAARALGEGEDGWAKHETVFFKKLDEHGLRDHLLRTIGLWGGPEPSFNAFVKGNVDATFALAKDWGRAYKQDAVAVLIPDSHGAGGISRWAFDRDLADDELDNLLGAMTAINQRQQQAALRNGVTPVQIGLTVKSTREFEYWYVDKEDRDAVAAFIEEAMLLAKLNPNQRSWSKGYRLLFFSANVDYPIEE